MTTSTVTRTDGSTIHYISTTETAQMIRRALRETFPGVRFSVRQRSSTWSMAIEVRVPAGGPQLRAVEDVTRDFASAGFDGSIDLQYPIDAVLDADGYVVGHRTHGTVGSMGYVPAQYDPIPVGGRLVHFGAAFVQVSGDPAADLGPSIYG